MRRPETDGERGHAALGERGVRGVDLDDVAAGHDIVACGPGPERRRGRRRETNKRRCDEGTRPRQREPGHESVRGGYTERVWVKRGRGRLGSGSREA